MLISWLKLKKADYTGEITSPVRCNGLWHAGVPTQLQRGRLKRRVEQWEPIRPGSVKLTKEACVVRQVPTKPQLTAKRLRYSMCVLGVYRGTKPRQNTPKKIAQLDYRIMYRNKGSTERVEIVNLEL